MNYKRSERVSKQNPVKRVTHIFKNEDDAVMTACGRNTLSQKHHSVANNIKMTTCKECLKKVKL